MNLEAEEQGDPGGLETLEEFSHAPAFNRWLFENLAPFCKGKILEIGSGIGNISRFLMEMPGPLTLTDLRPGFCAVLKEQYAGMANLESICQVDISLADFDSGYPGLLNRYDTVLASNVIEHIGNDALAVQNCRKLLTANGHLIVLVPAYQWLHNSLDEGLGHFRRYNANGLKTLLHAQDMEIIFCRYFNFGAIAGWWFSGNVLKKKIVPYGPLWIYNKMVPVFRLVDHIVKHRAGLSVIAVAKTS